MNKISTLSLSATVAGAYIGAGFVSGQELWQFFGVFGGRGIFTLILSLAMLGALCSAFMIFCHERKCFSLDGSVFVNTPKPVTDIFCFLEMMFYFFLCVIMTSGFIALINSFWDITTARIAGFIFALITGAAIFLGLHGLIRLFALFVPLLVVATVIISVTSLLKNGIIIPDSSVNGSDNPLLSSPLTACFVSLSYNFFGSVGILAPLSQTADSKNRLRLSSILGALMLALIALSIILAIFSSSTQNSDMPMLEIAKGIHPFFALIYAALLSFAMFSCNFSSGVCVILYVGEKFLKTRTSKAVFISVFCLLFYLLSLAGFANLISVVYPIFGYIGFIVILTVIFNTFRRNHNV
jgi:uncharacterized membrane protein YkvI